MKIYILSNSPLTATGYGEQTALFSRALVAQGHEVIVRCNWGHNGSTLKLDGMTLLPGSHDVAGNDVLISDYQHYKPDAGFVLYDAWVFDPDIFRKIPIALYAPVDHDPITAIVAERLMNCRWTWAMSRFAEYQMRRLGCDPFYVPHATDCETFTPIDRKEARRKWGVNDDTFYVAMNAANKGFPSRKSIDRALKAWGKFIQKYPKSRLHLHTHVGSEQGGVDIRKAADFYAIPDENLVVAEPAPLRDGLYSHKMLNDLYNAADVLLAPSTGEGFGIPVIEAQSAGCPVIVSDFTAQAELGAVGYKIPLDSFDDLAWTVYGSEQANIRPSMIVTALEWAYENRDNEALRAASRQFALNYDIMLVANRHLLPALETMAVANRG